MLAAARAIAEGKNSWSEVKEYPEVEEGRKLPDASVARVSEVGRVSYGIADPCSATLF